MVSNKWLSKGYRAVIEETVGESPRFARTTLSHRDNDLFSSSPLLFSVFLSFFSFSLYRFFLSLLLLFHAIVSLYRVVVVFVFLRLPLPSTLFVIRFRRLTLITLNRR